MPCRGVPGPRRGAWYRGDRVPGGDPPGRLLLRAYASYWNAFLFLVNSQPSVFNYYFKNTEM